MPYSYCSMMRQLTIYQNSKRKSGEMKKVEKSQLLVSVFRFCCCTCRAMICPLVRGQITGYGIMVLGSQTAALSMPWSPQCPGATFGGSVGPRVWGGSVDVHLSLAVGVSSCCVSVLKARVLPAPWNGLTNQDAWHSWGLRHPWITGISPKLSFLTQRIFPGESKAKQNNRKFRHVVVAFGSDKIAFSWFLKKSWTKAPQTTVTMALFCDKTRTFLTAMWRGASSNAQYQRLVVHFWGANGPVLEHCWFLWDVLGAVLARVPCWITSVTISARRCCQPGYEQRCLWSIRHCDGNNLNIYIFPWPRLWLDGKWLWKWLVYVFWDFYFSIGGAVCSRGVAPEGGGRGEGVSPLLF